MAGISLKGQSRGAKGDNVSIQAQGAYRKACIASQDSKACYDIR